MRRFTVAPEGIDGRRVVFDAAESHHLARVVRLRPGDTVIATDGAGHDYTVRLETVGEHATGTLLGVAGGDTESPLAITLVQGIPKGEQMERIVRAATELGAVRVLPAICERTIVRLDAGRWRDRARRWQRVAKEAAKLSGRARVPVIEPVRPLIDWLDEGGGPGPLAVCLWEGAAAPLERALSGVGDRPHTARVLVGPEGGLARAEVDAASARGWTPAALGPRVVRAETAGATILAILQCRFGDLGERTRDGAG
jgi:16S rRNA (uracil1498-N3)-methyltransferase